MTCQSFGLQTFRANVQTALAAFDQTNPTVITAYTAEMAKLAADATTPYFSQYNISQGTAYSVLHAEWELVKAGN